MFNLDSFINQYVINRETSMFAEDVVANKEKLMEKVENKTILVIGGAGSIGSSFIKALLPYRPSALVVVDTNENALAELTRELRSTKGLFIPSRYLPYPMDFASPVFERMFRSNKGFDIVGNFSAHKHVRSEKDIYSIQALIGNNLLHAKKLLDLLEDYPPQEYFCVSTDKATNPVNIMGASKRIMEDLIFSYSDKFPVKTARFANVAFSNGSLPAGFLQRISKLQPISAPFDVKRYFVSPEESGQICMLSCLLGGNREIFFPKLLEAQMMTFDSIATSLLKEHGYEILQCSSEQEAIDKSEELKMGSKYYPVFYSSADTSGEKSVEEFYTDAELVDMKRFKALGVIIGKEICNREDIFMLLNNFEQIFEKDNLHKSQIVELIESYLPNFRHIETGITLDGKM